MGNSPRSVATGDFDEDSHTDLAVTSGDGYVSILFGVGDGTLIPGGNYNTGLKPWDVKTGDFDADGHVDLVTANNNSDNISLLIGSGNGTFTSGGTLGTGYAPYSVATGDFNADGETDLAVVNGGSADVSIFPCVPGGTFNSSKTYGSGVEPRSVATGDFDMNGCTDLAVANGYSAGTVSILLNIYCGLTDAEDNVTDSPPYSLSSNYPNPFNPVTTIRFTVPVSSHVCIDIYDVTGRKVRVLVDRKAEMGTFQATWDGRNNNGELVESGVYFARMAAGSYSAVRKMILLR